VGASATKSPAIRPPQRHQWHPATPGSASRRKPPKSSRKNLDKFIYELQDKSVDLRRLRDHIRAIGGTITDLNDAFLGEELSHKRLAHRTQDFVKAELRPLLGDMRARGVGMQDLETSSMRGTLLKQTPRWRSATRTRRRSTRSSKRRRQPCARLSAGAPRCKGRHTDRWEFSPYRRRWSPACRKPKAGNATGFILVVPQSFPKAQKAKSPTL